MNRYLAMIAGVSAFAFILMSGPAQPNVVTYSAMESIGHVFAGLGILIIMGGFIAMPRLPKNHKNFGQDVITLGIITSAFGLSIVPMADIGRIVAIPLAVLLSAGVAQIITSMHKAENKGLRAWPIGLAMFTGSMSVHSLADGWSFFGTTVFLIGGFVLSFLFTQMQWVEPSASSAASTGQAGARASTAG